MKKNRLLCCVILTVLFCSCKNSIKENLIITGDVHSELVLYNYDYYTTHTIDYKDKKVKTILVHDVLTTANVFNKDSSVVFSSFDGVMASIDLDELIDCKLLLSEDNGWQLVSPHHPPQASVKHIEHIVVVANSILEEQAAFRIISGTFSNAMSYGQLFLHQKAIMNIPYTSVEKNNYTIRPVTRLELIPLATWAGDAKQVLAYANDGSETEVSPEGFIEWRGNSVDYVAPNGKNRIADIIGLWYDAPELSITDIYKDAVHTQEDVLLIELDGLGYEALYYHPFDFLQTKNVHTMRTVMPSISNVALASIITGTTPDKTTVHVRGDRMVAVEDMFTKRDSIVVEGFSKLIEMSLDQILNADFNENGSTDDEVFASALEALEEDKELTFVHFHGLDDVSHTYGPFSSEARGKAIELDGYVKALSEQFDGIVIIISDHGQYDSIGAKKGSHGTFVSKSMTVPYIVFEVDNER